VFIQKTLASLQATHPELCFHLYLHSAVAADRCAVDALQIQSSSVKDFNAISYEFFSQGCLIYETEVSDSKKQQNFLLSLIGNLLFCRRLEKDDYEALTTKVAQYAARLLKKVDQCRMILECSHLFFAGDDDNVSISAEFNLLLQNRYT